MNLPFKLTRKGIFLLAGIILIWIFPLVSIIVSFSENDILTGFFALIIGIFTTIILYILLKIIDIILPSVT
ncbi:MAG: hypothetical protein ACFFAU_15520 [Candidatus Hodarchaeota archaeon]